MMMIYKKFIDFNQLIVTIWLSPSLKPYMQLSINHNFLRNHASLVNLFFDSFFMCIFFFYLLEIQRTFAFISEWIEASWDRRSSAKEVENGG